MNTQRILIDMPVNHDAAPSIADVPLGREVLVPGSEVLGISRASRRSVAPDTRIAGMQCAVGDDGDSLPQRIGGDVSPSDVSEVFRGRAGLEAGHALKTGVRSKAIQA